ncbi:MAG: hypothetical protein IPO53_11830 [Chitinophagaceae bacterium]|nr:hypothetical protein [Chitinophagaceae bacterium]
MTVQHGWETLKEYTNNTNQDYSYDGNGNMINDNNKRINNIAYNHMNLPDSMKVRGYGTNKDPQEE